MAVVRIRPPGRDEYGDLVDDDDTYADLEIPEAFTAPRTSGDTDGPGRDGAVVGLTLYLPAWADVVRTDLIEVDGVRYRIDGDLADWTSPLTGWEPGLTADLARAEG